MIRKARIADVKAIHKLLIDYARDGLMLSRSLADIYEALRDFYVAEEDGRVVGTVCLHICWDDLAEVRSLAVASESARIGFTAVNVGLFCLGPAVPLNRVMGRKRALELLLFGDLIPAAKALEFGLVNLVVPEEELEAKTLEYARKLAQKSPLAVQLSKKAYHASLDMELHQAFDYMNEAFARLCSTDDAHEGVQAFLEKRKPEWKGR